MIQEGQSSVTSEIMDFFIFADRLGVLGLSRNVVRLTDRQDMTITVYRGRKAITNTHTTSSKILNRIV